MLKSVDELFQACLIALGGEAPKPAPIAKVQSFPPGGQEGNRPGDQYNREHPGELLTRHGWKLGGIGTDERERWTRPGKDGGTSASLTSHNGVWQFHSFSPNGNLPAKENLSPLALLAHLEHGGDFTAAARDLAQKGYGMDEFVPDPCPGLNEGGTKTVGKRATKPDPLPYKTFPVEALPDHLREFVEALSANKGIDPGWVAPGCLTTAGASIGMSRNLTIPGKEWTEPPSLWTAVVGE